MAVAFGIPTSALPSLLPLPPPPPSTKSQRLCPHSHSPVPPCPSIVCVGGSGWMLSGGQALPWGAFPRLSGSLSVKVKLYHRVSDRAGQPPYLPALNNAAGPAEPRVERGVVRVWVVFWGVGGLPELWPSLPSQLLSSAQFRYTWDSAGVEGWRSGVQVHAGMEVISAMPMGHSSTQTAWPVPVRGALLSTPDGSCQKDLHTHTHTHTPSRQRRELSERHVTLKLTFN